MKRRCLIQRCWLFSRNSTSTAWLLSSKHLTNHLQNTAPWLTSVCSLASLRDLFPHYIRRHARSPSETFRQLLNGVKIGAASWPHLARHSFRKVNEDAGSSQTTCHFSARKVFIMPLYDLSLWCEHLFKYVWVNAGVLFCHNASNNSNQAWKLNSEDKCGFQQQDTMESWRYCSYNAHL